MAEVNLFKQALEEIAEINDIALVDSEEGLTKLLFELNDRFLEIQSIARTALGEAKREELLFDQTADQVPDQFEPFPDEVEKCPECGKPMVLRHGKHGDFYGCSGYPLCRQTRNIDENNDQSSNPFMDKHTENSTCNQMVQIPRLGPGLEIPKSMVGEANLYLNNLGKGDLNDAYEMDEHFSADHGPFGDD